MAVSFAVGDHPTHDNLRALDAMARHIEERGASPTLGELAERMGLRAKSAVRRPAARSSH